MDCDREIRRRIKFINWLIDGQFQHGITPMMFPDLTPERVEEMLILGINYG